MPKKILSEEDKALFRLAMESVTPLKKGTTRTTSIRKPKKVKKRWIEPNSQEVASTIFFSSQYADALGANTVLSHNTALPHKRFQQLQKGKIPWEAYIDLHGLTVDSASDSLREFIVKQLKRQARCILIIHGKGGYNNEHSLIKSLVNHWLKQIPEVIAFHSALPREGGTGAVYVLLKKNTHSADRK